MNQFTRTCAVAVSAWAATTWCPSLLAQTVPDAGSLRQQIERDRLPALPGRVAPERPAEPPAMKGPKTLSVVVKRFRFSGNTILTDEQLAPAVAPFLNRPLDFTELRAAAAAVANTYRQAGWIVRTYLPEQDIVGGVVTIQVVEAVFGKVDIERTGNPRIKDERVAALVEAQQKKGEPLRAEAIDRALLLAEDLPGASVAGSLQEGAQKGESDLVMRIAERPLVTGDVTVDNTGSRSTGRGRVAANVSFGSPFGVGDRIDVNAIHTDGSDYMRLGGTRPFGSDGLRMGINASHLDYRLVAPEFSALHGHGTSDTAGIEGLYPVIRSRLKNLYLNFNLDHKTFDNQSGGAVTTHYKADTATVSLIGNLFDNVGGGGANSASLSLVTGVLDLNGSPNQTADSVTTRTDGRFSKLRYALSRLQVLTPTLSAFGSLSGQFADKNLDSSEKFYLGGSSGVRAYPASEGGGTEGWLANFELRQQLPWGFNLAEFYDHGHVTVNRDNDFAGAPALNRFGLRGAGVSLAWLSSKGLSAKLTVARRIDSNPNRTATGNDQDGTLLKNRVWLSSSLPF